jgi:hypothetical protein
MLRVFSNRDIADGINPKNTVQNRAVCSNVFVRFHAGEAGLEGRKSE